MDNRFSVVSAERLKSDVVPVRTVDPWNACVVPARHKQEGRCRSQAGDDFVEKVARGRIGPLLIFEQDQDRGSARQITDQIDERLLGNVALSFGAYPFEPVRRCRRHPEQA